MINQDKWIGSIKANNKINKEINQLDPNQWINTLPKIPKIPKVANKENTYNSITKYSIAVILFVSGIVLVSGVKNETRNLQKEINNLEASINAIKYNLDQAILDEEALTSPENISILAKQYLDNDFVFYNNSQIKHLSDKEKKFTKINKKNNETKNKKLRAYVKLEVTKKIEKKKTEIRKLQELYSKPESIPGEIKKQVAKKIKKEKTVLKDLYTSPKETITLKKAQKWAAIQVVKAFLGIPMIPGK